MIYTVTLNPSIDYIVSPEDFVQGKINRYSAVTYAPGGKGVNVSLLLTSLGMENTALGIAAGFAGKEVVRYLSDAGCIADFVMLPEGCSRFNIKICPSDGEETDLNGDGPEIPESAVDELICRLHGLEEDDVLVLGGSVPSSLSGGVYAKILKSLEGSKAHTVVDTTGEALLETLKYRPFLVKPNHEELGELFGVEIDTTEDLKLYSLQLQKLGARNVLASMGERGALLAAEDGCVYFCHAVKRERVSGECISGECVSTVGAGDSMVAGFLFGYRLHGTFEGGLRWGICAGSATAFRLGVATGDEVKKLFPAVGSVHRI